jgi:flagellar basal body rod protein FlgG
MTDLIMQLAGVMQRDIDSLKDVSQNVANANTPGYKASRSFNVLVPVAGASDTYQGLNGIQQQTSIETKGGALQQTGRATDLALDGDAWFGLQTPQGAMLTRDGRFHVDSQGYLVSASGYPVMGEDGPILVTGGELKVDAAGVVSVDGQQVGQLSILRVDNPQSLIANGAGLFASRSSLLPGKDYRVHQAMQEGSNAAMGDDMVKMMEITRHVESMQRALSAYDGLLDSGINQLGKD